MKKKIIIMILIISIVSFGLIMFFVVKNLKQEEVLWQEDLSKVSSKNLVTGNFIIGIKTISDYAYIEEVAKKYNKKISDSIKIINSYLDNGDLKSFLSLESLIDDSPNFITTHSTIKNTKEKINKTFQNIVELCSEEAIKELIDKEKNSDSDYYYDLYLKLMYTEKDIEEMAKLKKEMESSSKYINKYLDKIDEILTFLQTNNSDIEYNNNAIYFKSEIVLNNYKKLISELDTLTFKSSSKK